MEGLDVEVLSSRLLKRLDHLVKDPYNREHVTSAIPMLLNEGKLTGFVMHTVLSDYDYSSLRSSVDTPVQYRECNEKYANHRRKKTQALEYGSVST